MSSLDCGDNSCVFATTKGGMRTNGGCRCLRDLSSDRRLVVTRHILAVEADLKAAVRELGFGDDVAAWRNHVGRTTDTSSPRHNEET
jgi:hypothetical protein